MQHSESVKEIAAALVLAQTGMKNVAKEADNPFYKSKYATLAAVVDAVKPSLLANDIAYFQAPVTKGDECGVETMLMHKSGEWLLADAFYVPVNKADAQGFGSALTYCRRYSLAAACGVAPEDDDDGNAATAAKPVRPNTATQVAVDAFDSMTAEMKDYISSHAKAVVKLHEAKGDMVAYVENEKFDTESKLALWSQLPSNVRSAYKAQQKKPTPADFASQA